MSSIHADSICGTGFGQTCLVASKLGELFGTYARFYNEWWHMSTSRVAFSPGRGMRPRFIMNCLRREKIKLISRHSGRFFGAISFIRKRREIGGKKKIPTESINPEGGSQAPAPYFGNHRPAVPLIDTAGLGPKGVF